MAGRKPRVGVTRLEKVLHRTTAGLRYRRRCRRPCPRLRQKLTPLGIYNSLESARKAASLTTDDDIENAKVDNPPNVW